MNRTARIITLAMLFCFGAGSASWATGPLGLWWNEDKTAKIEVAEQEGALAGTIVWLKNRNEDGTEFRDTKNPDPALRNRTTRGITLLEGLKAGRRAGTWEGGTIYDPDNGKTYRCRAKQDGEDRLEIRGFIGVSLLGRTTVWERVQPEDSAPAE